MIEATPIATILEAVLFTAGEPLSIERLAQLFPVESRPSRSQLREALVELQLQYAMRAVRLVEVASGYRFQATLEYAPWIQRLQTSKPPRYSRAFLETVAIIAYKQPITRAEIEAVRGVAVSSHIMKTLLEYEWIQVVGNKQVPGRPPLYATTAEFLNHLNVKSLAELPELSTQLELMEAAAKEAESKLDDSQLPAKLPQQGTLPLTDLQLGSEQSIAAISPEIVQVS